MSSCWGFIINDKYVQIPAHDYCFSKETKTIQTVQNPFVYVSREFISVANCELLTDKYTSYLLSVSLIQR